MTISDAQFLSAYDASQFEHPSVAVDILIFTVDIPGRLELLMIRRDIPPFCNAWALPGGFIGMKESLDEAARRKLKEETGLDGVEIEQLYTFGAVDRDPRTRVISVAYFALLPKASLHVFPGPGADRTAWVGISLPENGTADQLQVDSGLELAFDHRQIITTAVNRLRGKLSYTDIAFGLLQNKNRFAIYELQKIYEAILDQKLDTPNFRRMFLSSYVSRGLAEATGEDCLEYSKRASKYYRLLPAPQK